MEMRCFLKKNYREFIDRCLESAKTRNANIGKIKKLVLIDVASAIKPTNNGPISIPPYPRVAILAIAVP